MERTKVREGSVPDSREYEIASDNGKFVYRAGKASKSSGVKILIRGTFVYGRGVGTDAVMVVFERGQHAAFAQGLTMLSQFQLMGVGPRLLCPYVLHPSGRAAFVEEDVGISLEEALCGGAVPYANDASKHTPLCSVGSERRAIETKKILFDVLVQMNALHEHGISHRDLRPANICVRRFGDKPQDLRATLVDFDLSAHTLGKGLQYENQPFVHLFRTLPGALGLVTDVAPTALEIDAAYVAALRYVTLTGRPIQAASVEDLAEAQGEWPLFGYKEGPHPYFARRIFKAIDIDGLASDLGLVRVGADAFPDPAVLELARRVRHGGYVDACDLVRLRAEHPEGALFDAIEGLSRKSYASYVSQVQRNGLAVAYETFEQQPSALAESTREQVRDIPNKVFALGLAVVERCACDPGELVEEFSKDEVEFLAFLEHERWCEERRASGWTYGPTKHVSRRISNALAPYGELPEDVKEYDRVHVREIPRLLASVGLGLVRAR